MTRDALLSAGARDGGAVAFLDGDGGGSVAVLVDPAYHSSGREGLGCFGLLTACSEGEARSLVRSAIAWCKDRGAVGMRGPVNVPRFLHGYGLQLGGFGLPAVAGVSSDPPAYKGWFDGMVAGGTLREATRYVSWVGSREKGGAALARVDGQRGRHVLPAVHPDLDDPGTLPGQIAAIMNAEMRKRPDGFRMEPADVLGLARLFKMVPGGERLLAFVMDGDVLAGGVIMQPDWFQVLAGERPTRLVQDTIVTARAYQGRGLAGRYFQACHDAMVAFDADYFEYIYSVADDAVVNHFGATYCLPGKAFAVYEAGW